MASLEKARAAYQSAKEVYSVLQLHLSGDIVIESTLLSSVEALLYIAVETTLEHYLDKTGTELEEPCIEDLISISEFSGSDCKVSDWLVKNASVLDCWMTREFHIMDYDSSLRDVRGVLTEIPIFLSANKVFG